MSSQVNIQGLITSTPVGSQKIGPLVVSNTINIAAVTLVSMSATISPSAISVPVGATACIITPPNNTPTTITFKTSSNSGDTGLPISPTQSSLFAFAATIPTTITFAFGATFNGTLDVKFF